MKKKVFCYLSAFVLMVGCISTQLTSVTDPFYKGKIVKKIMVFGKVDDLNKKELIESRFNQNYDYYDLTFVKGSDLLPPTRNYTEDEVKQVLLKNNIDAVLIISIEDLGYKQVQVNTYEPYQTQGNIYKTGTNQYQYQSTTSGGNKSYNVEKPYLIMKSIIIDPNNGKTMWMASSTSKAGSLFNINDLLIDYSSQVMIKLETDGFIIRK